MMSVWGRRTLAFVALMTTLRIFVTSGTELSDTEAYYVGWARSLELSYYDHPPLVAWTTWVVSHATTCAFALRLPTVVCTAVFAMLVHRLALRMFSPRAAFVAVVIVNVLPSFLMTGVLVNPEALLAPLWALALTMIYDLRERDEWWRPIVLGGVIGVGFLAKYTAVLAVPLAIMWVVSSSETRRWLRRPSFYLGGVVALIVAMPVIVWNASRGFPSVTLHLVERAAPPSVATYASNSLHALLSQLSLFHPVAFPGLVVVAAIMVARARHDVRFRFLAWMAIPTFAFFFVMMTRVSDSEPHWTMVAYVPLAIAMGAVVDGAFERPLVRAYFGLVVGTSALGLALYFVHMASPILLRIAPDSIYDANADPVNETLGWERIDAAIARQADALGPNAVVASSHNVLCGHLEVALDDSPKVYCVSKRRTEFDFMGRAVVPSDAPVVYVDSARYPRDPALALAGRSCALSERVDITRGGHFIHHMRVWACSAESASDGRSARQASR